MNREQIEIPSDEMGASGYSKLAWKIWQETNLPMTWCIIIDQLVREQGYRKQSESAVEVARCVDCAKFIAYTENDKAEGNYVEGTDGFCFVRCLNSNNKQFCACKYDDFCSFAKIKGGE